MKCIMPETQPSLQIYINFFPQTNGWISYITKSLFRSLEQFWMHLHITNNVVPYHGLVTIYLVPRASFLMQSDWSLCIRKKALGTRWTGHASLLSFQTQQEHTVVICWVIGKAKARAQKKNISAKGYLHP